MKLKSFFYRYLSLNEGCISKIRISIFYFDYLKVKYGLNLLKKSNNPNIINIGSVHSQATSNNISAYACSKSALVGLTKNMALELAEFNIRVNLLIILM